MRRALIAARARRLNPPRRWRSPRGASRGSLRSSSSSRGGAGEGRASARPAELEPAEPQPVLPAPEQSEAQQARAGEHQRQDQRECRRRSIIAASYRSRSRSISRSRLFSFSTVIRSITAWRSFRPSPRRAAAYLVDQRLAAALVADRIFVALVILADAHLRAGSAPATVAIDDDPEHEFENVHRLRLHPAPAALPSAVPELLDLAREAVFLLDGDPLDDREPLLQRSSPPRAAGWSRHRRGSAGLASWRSRLP